MIFGILLGVLFFGILVGNDFLTELLGALQQQQQGTGI